MTRIDGSKADELRPVRITTGSYNIRLSTDGERLWVSVERVR